MNGRDKSTVIAPGRPVVESAADEESGKEEAAYPATPRKYIFRGDDNYRGGPVGRALGAEADAADIQNIADHVLRKESNLSSRYTSFTEGAAVARWLCLFRKWQPRRPSSARCGVQAW